MKSWNDNIKYKELPLVSVVIPAKNEEKNICGCLDSIFACDYPRDLYEVIVVDNGSSDKTTELCIQKGVQVFISQESTISGLRNIGAKKAKGNIIAFLDADCLVTKNWLKAALSVLKDEQVIACGSVPIVGNNGTWVQKTWEFSVTDNKEKGFVDWLPSMNILVKKDFFNKIRGFDESLITCEDVDFCYRLKYYGKIFSDKRIQVIHLGEPKTLHEFYLKELWRGQSNYRGVFKHGFVLGEIPTLLMPIYISTVFGLVLFSITIGTLTLLAYSTLLFLLPAFVLAVKKSMGKRQFKYLFKLIILYLLYFIARTLAIFKRFKHKSERIAI